MVANTILEVKNLDVVVPSTPEKAEVNILNNISISLREKECIGIIGGSGSGKSVLMNAIINSLKEPLIISSGEVSLEEKNILSLSATEMRDNILGKQIASICPNPHWRLDPINTIGDQICDIYMSHNKCKYEEAKAKALELLKLVGIPDPETRFNAYPHELSGGMAQRVLVTIALICEPKLLLADEPTGGLDVTIQIQVFNLIRKLIREQHRSTVIASRDIGLIYHLCDRIYVLHEGSILESGNTDDIIHNPVHPYTNKLIQVSESNHEMRQSEEYKLQLADVERKYIKLVEERGSETVDGYIDLGNDHFVGVSK